MVIGTNLDLSKLSHEEALELILSTLWNRWDSGGVSRGRSTICNLLEIARTYLKLNRWYSKPFPKFEEIPDTREHPAITSVRMLGRIQSNCVVRLTPKGLKRLSRHNMGFILLGAMVSECKLEDALEPPLEEWRVCLEVKILDLLLPEQFLITVTTETLELLKTELRRRGAQHY